MADPTNAEIAAALSESTTRRPVAPGLEARLGEPIPVLDHGFVRLDDAMATAGRLVALVAGDGELLRVGQLVERAGATPRALQRLFRDYVGASPKWVVQRYRLIEAAERLAAGVVDGAALAHDLGYADQAHFTHDFRTVTGMTPGEYLKDQPRGRPLRPPRGSARPR